MNEFALTTEVAISLQRYPYPSDGYITTAPRSCGALPIVAATATDICAPSPRGEAFWIGLIASSGAVDPYRVNVTARLRSGDLADVGSGSEPAADGLLVPPAFMVLGIPVGEGRFWALAREPVFDDAPACDVIDVQIARGSAPDGARHVLRLTLLDEEEFVRQGGAPLSPLDPRAAYGGWRLP